MNKESLWELRQEIVLNSIYLNDYRNSFGIDKKELSWFFDGYMEELNYLMEEDMGENIKNISDNEYWKKIWNYDTKENLYDYYINCENVGF